MKYAGNGKVRAELVSAPGKMKTSELIQELVASAVVLVPNDYRITFGLGHSSTSLQRRSLVAAELDRRMPVRVK